MKPKAIALVMFLVIYALVSGFYAISEFDPEMDKDLMLNI